MVTMPIVDIPIDDSGFQKFAAAFRDYDEVLKKMPAEWQAVNARITELAAVQRRLGASADKAWSNATSAAVAYERTVKQAAAAQEHLGRTTTSAATAMHRMERSAKAMNAHLFSAVRLAAKLGTGVGLGLGVGLLGLGGLAFGLDRLSDSVLNRQRSARGLGLTVGQMESFRLNMARVAGTNVLAGAAEAQADAAKAGWLATLGINPQVAANAPASAVAMQEIIGLHNRLKGVPVGVMMNTAAALAARNLGMSTEDIRRIALTPGATLRADQAAVLRDTKSLQIPPRIAREWSEFSIQLHKAGLTIETALIRTLAPLTPDLKTLSREIAGMIVGLEKSGEVKEWVGLLENGLHDFADWLKSPAFKKDMKTFGADIEAASRGVVRALRWLHLIPPATPSLNKLAAAQATPAHPGLIVGSIRHKQALFAKISPNYKLPALHADVAAAAAKYHVPVGLMNRLAIAESSYGQGKLISKAGALGLFQIMPATGRALGYYNLFNPTENSEAAAQYMQMLLKKYHGDQQKAVAAYNWGMGNLDKDIARNGANWLQYAPTETRGEVAKVARRGAAIRLAHGITATPLPPPLAPGTVPAPHTAAAAAASHGGIVGSASRFGSDMQRIRTRILAAHRINVKVDNHTGAQTFVSANAAAL